MSVKSEPPRDEGESRELPDRITIPPIDGEMLKLRPATLEDLPKLDELDAFYNASRITGKDTQSERAAVQTWVRRSVAWTQGIAADKSGVGDPESRRTVAWSIIIEPSRELTDQEDQQPPTGGFIGMIFLIDIDGWARSARIQVVLGKDYRGRGYSRDAMPRVMTYGFAPRPEGLGMHRIWVAVPEKNSRSLSVYQSLGFELTGTSRDALWDAENGKYQDLNVLDTLADEYDPIRSLDAFGMHVIEHNPGVRSARAVAEASNIGDSQDVTAAAGERDTHATDPHKRQSSNLDGDGEYREDDGGELSALAENIRNQTAESLGGGVSQDLIDPQDPGDAESWPYSSDERKGSKRAWWRNFGRGHKNGKGVK